MISLVGYSGFVGSNLKARANFDKLYNSKNIGEAFGSSPDVLFYSGLPAEKFLADKFPEKDKARVEQAAKNITAINPKRVILISTVDVYRDTDNRTEDELIPAETPYGKNRLWLENFVCENFRNYNIIRLPGLFGENLKKNFIYDLLVYAPSMLTKDKIAELGNINRKIYEMYTEQENGFFRINADVDGAESKQLFKELGFSALKFTDSRALFQFYNLNNLYSDIEIAIKNDIKVINIATEPLTASDVYRYITQKEFVNELAKQPPYYNFKTKHFEVYGGRDGYLYSKDEILEDIKRFVEGSNL